MKRLLIGTYTNNGSEGIYNAMYENGVISDIKSTVKSPNPAFLAVSKDEKFLYALSESGKSEIYAFKILENTLEFINKIEVPGSAFCHISLSNDDKTLYGACWGSGDVYSVSLNEDRSVNKMVSHFNQNEFTDIKTAVSRGHFIKQVPDSNFVICVDLGLDAVIVYKKDGDKLTRHSFLSVENGEGPRHFAFNPKNNDIIYLITEYSSVLYTLEFNKNNGTLTIINKQSNLPKDFDGKSSGAAVKCSSDGKMVAASNRIQKADGSIAVYNIENIEPTEQKFVSSYGDIPRDFDFTPDNQYIIAANQNSNDVNIVSLDGKLVNRYEVSAAVFVGFFK